VKPGHGKIRDLDEPINKQIINKCHTNKILVYAGQIAHTKKMEVSFSHMEGLCMCIYVQGLWILKGKNPSDETQSQSLGDAARPIDSSLESSVDSSFDSSTLGS
jgi:hypothetical protein